MFRVATWIPSPASSGRLVLLRLGRLARLGLGLLRLERLGRLRLGLLRLGRLARLGLGLLRLERLGRLRLGLLRLGRLPVNCFSLLHPKHRVPLNWHGHRLCVRRRLRLGRRSAGRKVFFESPPRQRPCFKVLAIPNVLDYVVRHQRRKSAELAMRHNTARGVNVDGGEVFLQYYDAAVHISGECESVHSVIAAKPLVSILVWNSF
jgi:hypothetical protein